MHGISFLDCKTVVLRDWIRVDRCLRGVFGLILMAGLWKLGDGKGWIWRYGMRESLPPASYAEL